jgi:acetyl/propionyl-CoA carboxylase alpha subunit
MNTRLQVEHPVTEMIFGIDLVAEQLRVANGQQLAWQQEDLRARGHAMEARLYAEDPAQGFLPQTGEILLLELPSGPGVRVDSGVGNGDVVSLHYDPMLAKIVAYGPTRDSARRRLVEALRATVLLGVGNNLSYLREICEHPEFAAGAVHTGFLSDHLADFRCEATGEEALVLKAAAALLLERPAASEARGGKLRAPLLWQELSGFGLRPGGRS